MIQHNELILILDHSMDLFCDTEAILNSVVSNTYYGMHMVQIRMHLLPEHLILAFRNNRIQNGRRIAKKVY